VRHVFHDSERDSDRDSVRNHRGDEAGSDDGEGGWPGAAGWCAARGGGGDGDGLLAPARARSMGPLTGTVTGRALLLLGCARSPLPVLATRRGKRARRERERNKTAFWARKSKRCGARTRTNNADADKPQGREREVGV
jgi:hypothetical protein